MRAHYVAAVVAIIIITIGTKLVFFPPMKAEANILTMNMLEMHINHPSIKNMPVQRVHDMSLIFSEND